jgi:hypothetical protein
MSYYKPDSYLNADSKATSTSEGIAFASFANFLLRYLSLTEQNRQEYS